MLDNLNTTFEHSVLQGLLGDIGDGVILADIKENILYINKSAEEILEYSFDPETPVKFQDICQLVNLDTMEDFYSPIKRSIRQKCSVGLGRNIGIVRSDGPAYLSATCSPMRDKLGNIIGCSMIIRNINRIRNLEMKVEADQAYMRSVFEAARVGICSLNVNGELIDINESALDTMNGTLKESIGKRFGDAFDCINCKPYGCGNSDKCCYCIVKNNLDAAIADDSYTNDFVVAMRSNRSDDPIWLQVFLSQVWQNSNKQLVLSMIDISKRKLREIELNAARKEAEAASTTKTQFLANMSHEIRTPINGMCGMINLTLRTPLTDEQRENLNSAKQCSEDLLRIINDILDYAKLENGKMEIEKIGLNLYQLLDRVCKLHSQVAEGKGLKFNYPSIEGLPQFIKGDPLRIRQILHNLLTNAIKFTMKGSISVECRVTEQGMRRMLEFSVTDTGIGMSEEEQSKLFKPFSQVDGSTTRRFGGTGLGLMIVKELVSAMAGDIVVQSKPDYGSKFIFWIPLIKAEKADTEMKDKSVYVNTERRFRPPPANVDGKPDDDIADFLKYCEDILNN
ncbi:MAG: ATP-binding protein [Selenomonadaceae bacterium]|nr:ATP-binding protein [Selenomonadaceae bacterium]